MVKGSDVEILSLASIIASLTGLSIKDILKLIKKNKSTGISSRLIKLLILLEDDKDIFTGIWNVKNWKMDLISKKAFYVTGNLQILYKNHKTNEWCGFLHLIYDRSKSKVFILSYLRNIINKILGRYFVGIYSVKLFKDNGLYKGTTKLIYRDPELQRVYNGEFDNFKIKSNEIVCNFRNTGYGIRDTNKPIEVEFGHRYRWHEIIDVNDIF